MDDQYVSKQQKDPPILLYCGNEADIWMFYNTSGFQSETLAKEHQAYVIYAEHRFFGESIPKASPSEYLNVENAISDYINLI